MTAGSYDLRHLRLIAMLNLVQSGSRGAPAVASVHVLRSFGVRGYSAGAGYGGGSSVELPGVWPRVGGSWCVASTLLS